jgi:parvulin-like peptidyl-prolyl isomerase
MLYTEPKAIKARRLFVPVKQDATPAEEAAAKKQIEDAQAALKSGKKWEELAPQFTKDTFANGDLGFVQLGRSTLGRASEEAIFKLKPGETSDVVHDRFGYSIIQAQEERAPSEKKFDDVKRDIASDLIKESKAKDVARAAAQQTLTELKAGKSLETQWPKQEQPAPGAKPDPNANKTPHTVVTDEFHPAGGTIPQAGSLPKLSALVFSLSADKRFPDSVVEEQNAFWVVELKSRTRPDLSKLAAEKDSLREKIESTRKNDMRKTWVEQLRKDAKIDENPDLLSYERKSRGGAPEPDES